MRELLFIFFLGLPVIMFSQTLEDTCVWQIPKTITMDCRYGRDYEFQVDCNCSINDYELQIFDRWGNVVFQTEELDAIWFAGDYEGSHTFTWLITGWTPKNKTIKKYGSVTLLK